MLIKMERRYCCYASAAMNRSVIEALLLAFCRELAAMSYLIQIMITANILSSYKHCQMQK
jgi:hypothetical protein